MLPTEQQPVRCNIVHCEKTSVDSFVAALKINSRFKLKSALTITEKCHFERYNFLFGKNKVSIVYDTKANILSLTAINEIFDILKSICVEHGISVVQTPKPVHNSVTQQNATPPQDPVSTQKPQVLPMVNAEIFTQNTVAVQNGSLGQGFAVKAAIPSAMPAAMPSGMPEKAEKTKAPAAQSNPDQQKPPPTAPVLLTPKKTVKRPPKSLPNSLPTADRKQVTAVSGFGKSALQNNVQNVVQNSANSAMQNPAQNQSAEALLEYKNGFSIKKCLPERLDGILKRIRLLEGVTLKAEPTAFPDTLQEIKSYEINDSNKQKVKLRYTTKKQSLQLQGKRCNLFGEVQVILSRDSTYLSAVNSHIELTGEEKRAGEIQRQLKKLLADAFGFLSEQSKIDLSIGMIDINNLEVRLSDYSVLLVPPYRGLERLIFDLQSAQGISVKMIGQAYEKDDEGHYLLKSGYRKKIGSIVYSEVMSALYTEYFAQRNFYAHSDNSFESQVRRIEDKQTAKTIFDHLCKVINYNCKKLKEIGFDAKEA